MHAATPRSKVTARARRLRAALASLALLVLLPLGIAACAPGAPPPGPIDLIRKAIDPSYDYTQSPDTWSGADEDDGRYQRHARRDGWRSGCPEDDITCSHGGVTVCCAPRDRCCAGRNGAYCCDPDGAGYGDDGTRWYDDR